MEEWLKIVLAMLGTVVASNGFWAYMQHRTNKKDVRNKMLIGLAHDRIMFLCMQYLKRGYVTKDEYENLHNYLYESYIAIGGNGAAKHVMDKVDKLPLKE